MKLYLPGCTISDEEKKFVIDLKGNFCDFFSDPFESHFSEYLLGEDFFLTPLPIQFRKGDGIYLWVDWSESALLMSNTFKQQFQLTILDRVYQSANEICRHTNDYSVQIILEKNIDQTWMEQIKMRLEHSFSVITQFLE